MPRKPAPKARAADDFAHHRLAGAAAPFGSSAPSPSSRSRTALLMARAGDRFFVGEQAGKIFSFPNDQNAAKADLFLDVATELRLGQERSTRASTPSTAWRSTRKFAKNRYCYVCYVLNSIKAASSCRRAPRVSRFTVSRHRPAAASIRRARRSSSPGWPAGTTAATCTSATTAALHLDRRRLADPNPPDARNTGQDISDLLSSILRIDVDHEDKGKAYAVPPDNPFVKTPSARPEIWAYGFRNPWRMSFDRATGDLWVGDVGWELWEMVYRVKKGGNYGWAVMEGPQPVKPEGKRGPTPILPPDLAFPHTEAASITGGYVYHGKQLKDLAGSLHLRRLGDAQAVGHPLRRRQGRLAPGDRPGDAARRRLRRGHATANFTSSTTTTPARSIRLVPNPAAAQKQRRLPAQAERNGPVRLGEGPRPAPGVVPFSINAAQWADHATAERLAGAAGHDGARRCTTAPCRSPAASSAAPSSSPRTACW